MVRGWASFWSWTSFKCTCKCTVDICAFQSCSFIHLRKKTPHSNDSLTVTISRLILTSSISSFSLFTLAHWKHNSSLMIQAQWQWLQHDVQNYEINIMKWKYHRTLPFYNCTEHTMHLFVSHCTIMKRKKHEWITKLRLQKATTTY